MNEIHVALDHPVVFVGDFENKGLRVPALLPDMVASCTENCVAIRARSYVDGDVIICLSGGEHSAPSDYVQVFTGRILAPSRRIAVISSENEILSELGLDSIYASLKVAVDDVLSPGVLFIEVGR